MSVLSNAKTLLRACANRLATFALDNAQSYWAAPLLLLGTYDTRLLAQPLTEGQCRRRAYRSECRAVERSAFGTTDLSGEADHRRSSCDAGTH
jgi:hypothetical protein